MPFADWNDEKWEKMLRLEAECARLVREKQDAEKRLAEAEFIVDVVRLNHSLSCVSQRKQAEEYRRKYPAAALAASAADADRQGGE